MAKNLVIVESPAKAKTIEGYLGKDFVVKSSFGHVRDLPKKGLSIDLENNFLPNYEISSDKKQLVSELKKLASSAETVWLATDEDREGEAISWHLYEALNLEKKDTKRITFNEITKTAILKAIENPRQINKELVDAQQARRVLDRLVGFELSPVLWKKVRPNLSAGRVQSVAVRLIVEREKEIEKHNSQNFYKVVGQFQAKNGVLKAELDQHLSKSEDAYTFIEKNQDAQFSISDTASTKFTDINGNGFSTEFFIETPYTSKLGKSRFIVSVANLGFIKWSSRTDNYSVDSSFVWNGLNIDDVIGLSENGFEMPTLKDTLGIKSNKEQKVLALPTSFHFRMLRKLNGRKSYEAGLMVMPGRTSLPFIYGGFNHYVAPGFLLTERVTFGGFGNLNMGIEAQWLLNNRLYLRAGSNQLLGFLSPNSRGMNGFFGLSFFVKRSDSIIETEK
jgi:5S rRNA maturation endonuclease (ribonuclease M5)